MKETPQQTVSRLVEAVRLRTPLEEATIYQQLVDLGLSQREIADSVRRSQSHVSKRLHLLDRAAEEPAEPTISSPESSTGSDGSEAVSGVELAEASPAAAPAVPDSSAASNGHTPRRRKAATAVCRQCGRGEKDGVVFVELVDAGPLCDECSTSRPAPAVEEAVPA